MEISIVDICALSLSGTAIYISLKNRRNSLRENIYNRQLDLFQAMISDLVDIEEMLDGYIVEKRLDEFNEAEILKNKALDAIDDFALLEFKSVLLVPDKIDQQINYLSHKLSTIYINLHNGSQVTKDDLDDFGRSMFDLQEEIRNFIGLEKLSTENRRLTRMRGD